MKTPQEKKRLSYQKDRRNTYGENDKASRKNIPRAKARENRAERHAQDGVLARAAGVTEADALAALEVRARATKPRQWRKGADTPLGVVLARRRARNAL